MGLDKSGVKINWLLDFYGIGLPSKINYFTRLPSPLVGIDNQLWLEDRLILESSLPVLWALWYQKQIIAIDVKQLYIFDNLGQLLETQGSSSGLTPPLSNLSISSDNRVLLHTQQGPLLSDQQLLDWQSADETAPDNSSGDVSIAQALDISPKLLTLSRSQHLSWERVILDLHSGRLFGAWAIWLWDLFALALLILALSGIWMWQHKNLRR
jgi:hypothetical protein